MSTTIPIIPSGAFFPKTADGFIINPCSPALIDDRYQPIIEEIIKGYKKEEGSRLHSVYLRGSVPRGMAFGNCDIDSFALVFSENKRWEEPVWAKALQEKWKEKYSFLATAEIYLSSYAPVLQSIPKAKTSDEIKANPKLAMILKTQSLCIYGEDVSPMIPTYCPDENMMLSRSWLKADIADFTKNKNKISVRQQLLKTILRSGFELLMPRLRQYTPDLYLCYSSFAYYYPEKESAMKKVLQTYLNPNQATEKDIEEILNELGSWLEKKFV